MNEYVLCAFSDNTSSKGISWDPRDVGGTVMPRGGLGSYAVEGLFYAHVMLLLWGATSCVGWE